MSERFVFGPYWNGEREVYGDPLEINMALVGHARGQLARLIEASKTKGPDGAEGDSEEERANKEVLRDRANAVAFPALYKMREVARLAFDLAPFDKTTGSGATARDCDRVLTEFFAFLADVKKNIAPSLTAAPPTEPDSLDGP